MLNGTKPKDLFINGKKAATYELHKITTKPKADYHIFIKNYSDIIKEDVLIQLISQIEGKKIIFESYLNI